MSNEYFVMDDSGMEIPLETITPEMEEAAKRAFNKAMEEIEQLKKERCL